MNVVGGGREQIHTQESEDCVSTKPRGSPLLNTAPSIGHPIHLENWRLEIVGDCQPSSTKATSGPHLTPNQAGGGGGM